MSCTKKRIRWYLPLGERPQHCLDSLIKKIKRQSDPGSGFSCQVAENTESTKIWAVRNCAGQVNCLSTGQRLSSIDTLKGKERDGGGNLYVKRGLKKVTECKKKGF